VNTQSFRSGGIVLDLRKLLSFDLWTSRFNSIDKLDVLVKKFITLF